MIFFSLYSLVARLGEYDLYAKEDCVRGVCADPVVRINVADIIVHPGYGEKTHDIAILRLEEDAPYTGMYLTFEIISEKVTMRFAVSVTLM